MSNTNYWKDKKTNKEKSTLNSEHLSRGKFHGMQERYIIAYCWSQAGNWTS